MEKNNGKEKRAKEVQEKTANKMWEYNRNLFETSIDSLATIGPDGIITDVNSATEKATGLPREKIIGTDFSEYFTEPDKARVGYKQIFDIGKVVDYELYLKHINGSSIPVSYNASVYKDNEGQIIGVFAAARDISAIKKYKDELTDFEKKLELLVQQKTAELLIADEELVFQSGEKADRAAELLIANKELAFQNEEKDKRAAELVIANEALLFQNEEKEKRAAELIIANKELVFQNEEKDKRAAELVLANRELIFQTGEKADRAAELVIADEELVFQSGEKADRAAELFIANKELVFQTGEKADRAAELIIANRELRHQNKEKEKRAAELIIANKELVFQNEEKEKRAAELIIANKELVFQNGEKDKRAAELVLANRELVFQTGEKADRAAELVIADKELVFQIGEKADRAAELVIADEELVFQIGEKADRAAELVIADEELVFQIGEKADRAAELLIANKELTFQTGEKADRAAELIIANRELRHQNKEKEKRAAELLIANEELLFQNEEKEKRAAELIIANKELVFQNGEKDKRAAELVLANRELVFQTGEKADRAAELIIANRELVFQNEEKDKRAAELVIANEELFIEREKTEEFNNQLETRVTVRTAQLESVNKELIERALKELKNQNDLKKTHLALIKSEERYKALTQTSIDGFIVLDIEGRFLEVNDVYCKISGYSREALLSMNIKDLEFDEEDKQTDTHIQKIINEGGDKFENRHRKSDGTFFYVHNSVTFIPNEKLFICFLHDITNRKKTEKDLLYMIYHDYLTEIYNRRFFEEARKRLDKEENLPISIIMGDVNGLKLINDGFGHSKGDEALIEIAKILKSCCRKEDIVSRIGGDEFGILLSKTDSQSAQRICDSIYDTCKGYALDGSSLYPSISLGHATKNFETETMDNILTAAEEYMSRHKILESRSAHSAIIASIKVIMFEKSQETEEHAARMVQLSKSIGIAMSLTDDQLNELELLATLHDIGKMSIPAAILSKPGKLSDEEWVEMKKHPEVGYRIAQATSELVPIAKYILCHHERWDGKGYPQGLIGEKIPLLSRILAIADSFDAMTNDRSYRVAMTKEEAIEEIRRCSGTQFDPFIARVFIEKCLGKEWK